MQKRCSVFLGHPVQIIIQNNNNFLKQNIMTCHGTLNLVILINTLKQSFRTKLYVILMFKQYKTQKTFTNCLDKCC